MQNELKIPFLTPTLKRFIILNVFIFLIIIVVFNVLLFSVTRYVMHNSIDNRLEHEIEKVVSTLEIEDSSISIIDFSELNEPDFKDITKTPYFLQIYNLSGDILIQSDNIRLFEPLPIDTITDFRDYSFRHILIKDQKLRAGFYPLFDKNGRKAGTIEIATIETELQGILDRIIQFNFIAFPFIIIIIVLASIFVGKKVLAPVNRIIETAENISAKRLSSRIKIKANPDDELGRLRDTLNGLFDRIESYVEQLSQFTDHASHQLMNPLTALKTELEYILKKDRSTEEYKNSLRQILNQTDHMVKIVRTLLLLSKQDKSPKENTSIFNLSKLIINNVSEKINSHVINLNIEQGIYIKGDAEKFLMVVENLVDNAVKYSPSDTTINISLVKNANFVEFEVADNGIGIRDDEKNKIFDRFYRSKEIEKIGMRGYGLGLSLVKTILLELEAKIRIEDNEPNGSIFIVTLKSLNLE